MPGRLQRSPVGAAEGLVAAARAAPHASPGEVCAKEAGHPGTEVRSGRHRGQCGCPLVCPAKRTSSTEGFDTRFSATRELSQHWAGTRWRVSMPTVYPPARRARRLWGDFQEQKLTPASTKRAPTGHPEAQGGAGGAAATPRRTTASTWCLSRGARLRNACHPVPRGGCGVREGRCPRHAWPSRTELFGLWPPNTHPVCV